jgi:hypothetical protein
MQHQSQELSFNQQRRDTILAVLYKQHIVQNYIRSNDDENVPSSIENKLTLQQMY